MAMRELPRFPRFVSLAAFCSLLFSLYMQASFKSCRYPYVNSWFFAPQQNVEGLRLLLMAALMDGRGKVV